MTYQLCIKRIVLLSLLVLFLNIPSIASAAACPNLTTNLWRGMHDRSTAGQVSELQRFLSSYYTVNPTDIITGFFGPLTESYVFRFQREQGIAQVGSVGPITREAIAKACTQGYTIVAPVASPTSDPGVPGTDAGTSVTPGGSGSQSISPDIIVIMTDDQDDMGSLDTMPKTKKLLIDEGVRFKNSFVSFPQCCPSRASFLTGQYAYNHKVYGNTPDLDGGYAKMQQQEANSLPVWLQNTGYRTALIGKYLNFYGDGVTVPDTYIPKGWTEWQGMPHLSTYNYYDFAINHNGVIKKFVQREYQTDVLADRAVQYIASTPIEKPIFLWLTPTAPHGGGGGDDGTQGPVPAPRHKGTLASLGLPKPLNFNESDMSDKPAFMRSLPALNATNLDWVTRVFQNRRETLLAVDDMVEKVVNELQTRGRLDNAIIVLTSDNGFSQGEHRRRHGKAVIYEESIRVPLVIRGPGIPKGEIRNKLVNNLDLVATIVEASGATSGRELDGKSLKGLMTNADTAWRTALLVEGVNFAEGKDTFSPISRYSAIRSDKAVLAEHTSSEREFYDMKSDPYQLSNLATAGVFSHAESITQHTNALNTLKTCKGASCWFTSSFSPLPEPSVTTQDATASCTMGAIINVILTGGSATITWDSTNATQATDMNGASIPVKGSTVVYPPNTTTYTYTFKGTQNEVTCSQTIRVSESLTVGELPVIQRDAVARGLGFTGQFGAGGFSTWRNAEAIRNTVWDAIKAKLLSSSDGSVSQIYDLFPSLDPKYMTLCGVTKLVRDQKAYEMGFRGMFAVVDASGKHLGGELSAWLNASESRRQEWTSFCSATAQSNYKSNLASVLTALQSILSHLKAQ